MNTNELDQAITDLTSWLVDRCSDNPEDGQGFEDVDSEIDGVRELLLDLQEKQLKEQSAIDSLLNDIDALCIDDVENFGPFEQFELDQSGDGGATVCWPNLAISSAKLRELS